MKLYMSENERIQKKEEKRVTEKFYKVMGKNNIKFLPIEGVYPDCYVEIDNKKIAIELRRYYNQPITRENQNLRNMIKTWLKKYDNILEILVNRIKRPLSQKQTIYYKNLETMLKDIIKIEKNILEVNIKGRYIYEKEIVNSTNHTLPKNITDKQSIILREYINYMKDFISNGERISIVLTCKNGLNISIDLEYDTINQNKNEREIHDWDVWYEDKQKVYSNMLEAINEKINKFEKYYSKSESIIKYDEYNLIIYPEDIPPTLDEAEIYELVKYIKENVNQIKFDYIIIFILNKVLIISKNWEIHIFESSD